MAGEVGIIYSTLGVSYNRRETYFVQVYSQSCTSLKLELASTADSAPE
jgi:hypothetical protein